MIIKIQRRLSQKKIEKRYKKLIKESLSTMDIHWEHLKKKPRLASDIRFLHRMAITIRHLHYQSASAKKHLGEHQLTRHVQEILCKPLGSPICKEMTLLEASDRYSQQNPLKSDLSKLLHKVAEHSSHLQLTLSERNALAS